MDDKCQITVQLEPFDVARETFLLHTGNQRIGAIASFIGLVRDTNDGAAVHGLYLEHYPGMVEAEIARIVSEAGQRWPIESVRVIHRVGHLQPADPIVFVGVGSQHRGTAFLACEFIMDNLKARAPFWKKESGPQGESWLEAKEADLIKMQDWLR